MESAVKIRTPNAFLVGGPLGAVTETDRVCFVEESAESLKLDRGNRYEHYSRSPETLEHETGLLRVYTWTGSTFVAE